MEKTMKHTSRAAILLFAGALLVPTNTCSGTWDNVSVSAGLLVGAAALAVGGVIAYACSESDDAAADTAEQRNAAAKRAHSVHVDEFCAVYHITSSDLNVVSLARRASEEHELAPIAVQLVQEGRPMRNLLDDVRHHITDLSKSHTNLKRRIRKIEDKHYLNADESRVLRRMRRVFDSIADFLPYLELYHGFFYEHRHFFDLYEYESKLYRVYQQEFAYGHQYTHDVIALDHAIRQCIGTHQLHSSYKYIAYKQQLDEHIDGIQRRIKRLKYPYPGRYSLAVQLEQYLIRVRGIVIAAPAYAREKEARRIDRQHQQQIAIMQQQVAATQQLAYAEQARADAQRRQNRIDRERINRERYGVRERTVLEVDFNFR